MSEHTKGPWRYEPISTCCAVYQGSDYRMEVCRVNGRDGEQQANARLIAAAPQLLEACEAALGVLWEEQARLDSPTPFDRTVEQLEAALRAAREGE